MTGSEILMRREDPNIAWGFRLTGGSDLGTPFYVVKVLGRGHAEKAGLRVGDMVYAINHKYINDLTHKDAQNAILHSGDTLILNIKRGHDQGRITPLPEYADPLMGLAPPPETPRPTYIPPPPYEPPLYIREPTPPPEPEEEEEEEGPEETVCAFTVKINPRGKIAAIEELPVTPPRSRGSSRCRSRSRSVSRSRDRRSSNKRESSVSQFQGIESTPNGVPGPGETFTYSKETVTQYSTILSASNQTDGQTSEYINESFIIHGGSEHKMEDVLSPEDIERDIFEEKIEEQKITELLTGEAELLDEGIVGINFQKIIPKTNFIKGSNVFKELQDQRIKKEEPEEEQLKKDPNKRFSTFLQTPKRPVPKPKPKPDPPKEEVPWKARLASPPPLQITQQQQILQQEERLKSTTTWSETVNIVEEIIQETRDQSECDEGIFGESFTNGPVISEAISTEHIFDERVHFEEEADREDRCCIEEYQEQTVTEVQKTETVTAEGGKVEAASGVKEHKSEFERQLAEIQKQFESIQQLPSVLQANLAALQEQLTKIVTAKVESDKKEINVNEENQLENGNGDTSKNLERENEQPDFIIPENDNEHQNHNEIYTEDTEVVEVTQNSVEEHYSQMQQQHIQTEQYENLKNQRNGMQDCINELYENMKNQRNHRRDDDETSVAKPPIIRNFPCTKMERPIVLPGGRKWYKPRDAYNEDFIAETIIHQSEVLVGSTIGLNFCKYEPPKFDSKNSAVFRLVHELENRCGVEGETILPIEERPEKVMAEEDYFPPIRQRHFFAARLSEQTNVSRCVERGGFVLRVAILKENVEKILQDTQGQTEISV